MHLFGGEGVGDTHITSGTCEFVEHSTNSQVHLQSDKCKAQSVGSGQFMRFSDNLQA